MVIDDGSKDSTVKVTLDYSKKFGLDIVRVIKQGANFGKGAAVRLVRVVVIMHMMTHLKQLRPLESFCFIAPNPQWIQLCFMYS